MSKYEQNFIKNGHWISSSISLFSSVLCWSCWLSTSSNTPLISTVLRHNNDFYSRVFLLWQIAANWHKITLTHFHLTFYFHFLGGHKYFKNSTGNLYVRYGNNRWLGATHNHLNPPSTTGPSGNPSPVRHFFKCDRRPGHPIHFHPRAPRPKVTPLDVNKRLTL